MLLKTSPQCIFSPGDSFNKLMRICTVFFKKIEGPFHNVVFNNFIYVNEHGFWYLRQEFL